MEYEAHTPENSETSLPPADGAAAKEGTPAPGTEEAQAPADTKEKEGGEGQAANADTPDYADMEREDLAALAAAYPALGSLASLGELDDPARYGELRELGLSPKEAFLAVGGGRLLTRRVQDTRAHLATAVGRAAATSCGRLSAGELAAARDLFPALSDGEIDALYRRVEHPRHNH